MTLHEMQDFVGGYIELVQNIFCNEDGLRLGLPQNEKYPHLVGNVIVWERRRNGSTGT